jgi:hypothetical protein
MASTRRRDLYLEARKAGYRPAHALHAARTLLKWRALERMGYVRLIAEPDEHCSHDDLCDCDNPDCPDRNAEVWGSVGQYRIDPDQGDDDGWEYGDSVWGHVGYRNVLDWRENPYITDIMAGTIGELIDARTAVMYWRSQGA